MTAGGGNVTAGSGNVTSGSGDGTAGGEVAQTAAELGFSVALTATHLAAGAYRHTQGQCTEGRLCQLNVP